MATSETKTDSKNVLLIGHHVNKDVVSPKEGIVKHIKSSIKEATEYGIRTDIIQIFVANPRSGKPTIEEDSPQFKELKEYVQSNPNIKFIIHSPYVSTALWTGNEYSAHIMRKELRMCNDSGILGVIIHLDSHDIQDVIKGLSKIMPKKGTKAKIYLESAHTKPDKSLYETPEKLLKLFTAIRKELDPDLDHIGFVIDTAHIFVCGADISNDVAAAKWVKGMELIHKIIPPENIIIHLNGSEFDCGDGRDKHAPLMSSNDKIWFKYKGDYKKSGLSQFLLYAREYKIPCILERRHNNLYFEDYKLLHEAEPSIRITKADTA